MRIVQIRGVSYSINNAAYNFGKEQTMAHRRTFLVSSAKTRERTGSDPTPYSSAKRQQFSNGDIKVVHDLPGIGQPCLKCSHKDCQGLLLHTWRKKCINCGCPPEDHKMESDPHTSLPFLENLSLGNGSLEEIHSERLLRKYAWYPNGISTELVDQYMASLPKESVPLKGSNGEIDRLRRFHRQLPPYDWNPEACHKLSELESKRFLKLAEKRRRTAYGVGSVEVDQAEKTCDTCGEAIPTGSVFVSISHAASAITGKERAWHPKCFQCTACKDMLVDLIYFITENGGNLYCGRHHADLMLPRCAGCDEIILESRYTEAKGMKWHKDHFRCSDCDSELHEKRYSFTNDKFACERCYNIKYAVKCRKCREPIGIGAKKLLHKGKAWHEECFVCKRCKEDLRELHFYLIDGDLFCGDCMKPVGQCFGCKAAISPTVSFLQHKQRCWHAECFKCNTCQAWLVDGQFHELENDLVCNQCYIDRVSKRCDDCGKAVIGKGVQFCRKVYHPGCFKCSGCQEVIRTEDSKVKEKNKQPYCVQCFIDAASKCYKCQEPILGQYTAYDGQQVHVDCFTCDKCGIVIGSKEYYVDKDVILCMACSN